MDTHVLMVRYGGGAPLSTFRRNACLVPDTIAAALAKGRPEHAAVDDLS